MAKKTRRMEIMVVVVVVDEKKEVSNVFKVFNNCELQLANRKNRKTNRAMHSRAEHKMQI